MGIRSHRDLLAWQKSDVVRRRVIGLLKIEPARRDLAFRDQADRASASACRNLAEGFYRYRHRDFARFVTIALSSLGELLDSADEARIKGYIDAREHTELEAQIQEALRVAMGLLRYLRSDNPAPGT